MTQKNVERLRAYCESWTTRAMPDFDLLDPEVVFEDDILPEWTFRDGRVIHIRSFREPEQALEATGLRE